MEARAFWIRDPGRGEIRAVQLPEPGPGEVLVRTLRSGVSRGTEGLVFRGGVQPSEYADLTPAAARFARASCRSLVRARCWCARCGPESAAAPRDWCSVAECHRASTPI